MYNRTCIRRATFSSIYPSNFLQYTCVFSGTPSQNNNAILPSSNVSSLGNCCDGFIEVSFNRKFYLNIRKIKFILFLFDLPICISTYVVLKTDLSGDDT